MQEGDGSSAKTLVKITGPVMVWPASSDEWKVPLVNDFMILQEDDLPRPLPIRKVHVLYK